MLRQGALNYVLNLRRGYRYLPTPLRRLLGVDSLLQKILRTDWNHAVSGESTPATRWWRYATAGGASRAGAALMQRLPEVNLLIDTLPLLPRLGDRSALAVSLQAHRPLLDHPLAEHPISRPD